MTGVYLLGCTMTQFLPETVVSPLDPLPAVELPEPTETEEPFGPVVVELERPFGPVVTVLLPAPAEEPSEPLTTRQGWPLTVIVVVPFESVPTVTFEPLPLELEVEAALL